MKSEQECYSFYNSLYGNGTVLFSEVQIRVLNEYDKRSQIALFLELRISASFILWRVYSKGINIPKTGKELVSNALHSKPDKLDKNGQIGQKNSQDFKTVPNLAWLELDNSSYFQLSELL